MNTHSLLIGLAAAGAVTLASLTVSAPVAAQEGAKPAPAAPAAPAAPPDAKTLLANVE
jgi:hypothetical protein